MKTKCHYFTVLNTFLFGVEDSTSMIILTLAEMAPAELLEIKNKDDTLAFKCWEINGIKLPLRVKDPDARFKELKELEYKDGDLIIASYPKVGKIHIYCYCKRNVLMELLKV